MSNPMCHTVVTVFHLTWTNPRRDETQTGIKVSRYACPFWHIVRAGRGGGAEL